MAECHKEFVNCKWCSTVRRRDTHEPVAEPLQTKLKSEIETHGMCGPCATEVRSSLMSKPEHVADALAEGIRKG
jgi:hypothetical protein